jgi:hypothetical protein
LSARAQIVRGGIFERARTRRRPTASCTRTRTSCPAFGSGAPPRPVVMAGRDGPPHRWPAEIDQLRSSVPDHDAGICQPADTFAVGLPIPQTPARAPGGVRTTSRDCGGIVPCRAALRGTRPRAVGDGYVSRALQAAGPPFRWPTGWPPPVTPSSPDTPMPGPPR